MFAYTGQYHEDGTLPVPGMSKKCLCTSIVVTIVLSVVVFMLCMVINALVSLPGEVDDYDSYGL